MKAGQGRNQIEYEDEDPSIRAMFDAICAERGVTPRQLTKSED